MSDEINPDPTIQTPFMVRCTLCNSVVHSWHRDLPRPHGTTAGIARCDCGNLEADSSGVPGRGRIVTDRPDTAEVLHNNNEDIVDPPTGTAQTVLAEIKAMANELGRSLAVENFGYYLSGPSGTDDTELGKTPADAKATLTRIVNRARRAEILRASE